MLLENLCFLAILLKLRPFFVEIDGFSIFHTRNKPIYLLLCKKIRTSEV